MTCVDTRRDPAWSELRQEYVSESFVRGDASPEPEICQMRKLLLGIRDAVISSPFLSGSHASLFILKNFSRVSPRSLPVDRSTSARPNSVAPFADCPAANAIDPPSGENWLSPMRKGQCREAIFLGFFPSIAS